VAVNDNAVVFRAQSSQAITTVPFIQFTYDTVSIGSYTDVWEGMVCYLSATTDIRDAFYRGRVRLAPSSSVFRIDENASVIADGTYIIVTRDTDLFSRIRRDLLVDGSLIFQRLPDVLEGLPSTLVLYDADNDGDVSYTTVQTPVHVDEESTATTTWAWDASGAGTVSFSNAAVQNPTITFQAGYHYLLRVRHTNDIDVTNYQIVHVYAIARALTAPAVSTIVAGSVSGSQQDGWTASLTAYANVSTLIDRTHAVVFHLEHFGDNSSTPIISNILMCGRIRSDSIQTEGSAEAGRIDSVTFAVEGLTAYMRRLRIPNDIIRAETLPSEWGEMIDPNPYRMAVYAAWTYSTLTNISSFGVESGAFADWMIGAEPRSMDGGCILDMLSVILDTIKAAMNYAPSGEIFLARAVSYREDRSGVVTVATFAMADLRDYNIDRDSSKTTAQVIAFGGSFNSTSNTFDLYTAQAPSIVYGDASETVELTREILTANATITNAAEELSQRASNHYAFLNPKPLLQLTLIDSYSGVLIPTNYQRWNATIDADTNALGIAYGASDYWQLQSISLTLNEDGSIDTSAELPAETSLDNSQVIANLLPINLSNMNPVLPILPNDPAFPTSFEELYPTDAPEIGDYQAVDSFSGAMGLTPFPPDVAAKIAAKQGKTNCKTLDVLFSNSSNTTSNWLTTVGVNYLLTASGSTRTNARLTLTSNPLPPWNAQTLVYEGMDGASYVYRVGVVFTGVHWSFSLTGSVPFFLTSYTNIDGFIDQWDPICAFCINPPSNVSTSLLEGYAFTTGMGTEVRIRVTPATPESYADAFYSYDLNEEGGEINVNALTDGLYIDNAKYSPSPFPPFSPSHQYANMPFAGTGNVLNARTVFAAYTDVARVYLNLSLCRKMT
jgi:hypothetical protein